MLSKDELFDILLQSPEATAIFTSENIVVELANEKMLALWGKDRSVFGKPIEKALPELANQPFLNILSKVWRTGISFKDTDTAAELMVDGKLIKRYFDFELRAIKNDLGQMICIYNVATDVSQKFFDKENLQEAQKRIGKLNADMHLANTELLEKNETLFLKNQQIQSSENNIRQISASLDQSRLELNFAIEAAGLGFFDLDVDSTIFRANSTTKKWFNLPPEEDLFLSVAVAAMVPEDRIRVTDAINLAYEYESGGEYEITYNVFNTEKNELKTLHARGKVLFNEDKKPVRFSGIIQDVTEEAQDEKRKNDFIGMVSHELKTPLTIITGALQMLQVIENDSDASMRIDLHQRALNQVKKMINMVNSFLTVGALDSGKIPLQYSSFNVADLLGEVVEESASLYKNHRFILQQEFAGSLHADKNKLHTVLTNFISNATKYSHTDSCITIECRASNNEVIISVKDESKGIDVEDIPRLFTRYYRVQNDSSHSTPGFGIGLYLCAEIIKQHKGNIWVESEKGIGSTFYVSLPMGIDQQ